MASGFLLRTTRRIHSADDSDRGDIIVGWLTRVVLGIVLLGLIGFEGLALVTARVNGKDVANSVALEASEEYLAKGNLKAAMLKADTEATKHDAEVVEDSFTVDASGRVRLRLRRTATTLLLYRTKATAKWAVVVSAGNARSLNS